MTLPKMTAKDDPIEPTREAAVAVRGRDNIMHLFYYIYFTAVLWLAPTPDVILRS
jgi:hypothetical protein